MKTHALAILRQTPESATTQTAPERPSNSGNCDAWGHPYPAESKAEAGKCNGNCQGCTSASNKAAGR